MASAMSDALDHLYETIHSADNAGELVTYRIGTVSIDVLATLEKSPTVPLDLGSLEPGEKLQAAKQSPLNADHDFAILAKDLHIGGVPIVPDARHEIKRTFGGRRYVYRLAGSSDKNAVWEWMDGYDRRYLIHTKFVRFEDI